MGYYDKLPRSRSGIVKLATVIRTGDFKIVKPETVEAVRTGTRLAVTEELGTLHDVFLEDYPIPDRCCRKDGYSRIL